MRKLKRVLFFAVFIVLVIPMGVVYSQNTVEKEQINPEDAVPWDGESPLEDGVLYHHPECDETDDNAPCYMMATSCPLPVVAEGDTMLQSSRLEPIGSRSDTITCGVKVYNYLGQLVAKLWENVNVTWYTYSARINWAYRHSWVKNSMYRWKNYWGPSPSSGEHLYMFMVRTTADLWYLTSYWQHWEVRTNFTSYQSWYCSVY